MGAAEVAYFFPATADSTSTEWKFLLYLREKNLYYISTLSRFRAFSGFCCHNNTFSS